MKRGYSDARSDSRSPVPSQLSRPKKVLNSPTSVQSPPKKQATGLINTPDLENIIITTTDNLRRVDKASSLVKALQSEPEPDSNDLTNKFKNTSRNSRSPTPNRDKLVSRKREESFELNDNKQVNSSPQSDSFNSIKLVSIILSKLEIIKFPNKFT